MWSLSYERKGYCEKYWATFAGTSEFIVSIISRVVLHNNHFRCPDREVCARSHTAVQGHATIREIMNSLLPDLRARLIWKKALPVVLLIGGIIGLAASFALTYDKIHLIQDPSYQPGCNLNPVLSCQSVMSQPQAMVAGVPNTLFGLIAFSMLITLSLTLMAGATYKRWLWQAAQAMATAGVIFMHYLFYQSIFTIHAICPWCFVVWMITIPVFFGITIYNLRTGNLPVDRYKPIRATAQFVDRYSTDLLVLWYVIIFGVLLVRFWYYWRTLL